MCVIVCGGGVGVLSHGIVVYLMDRGFGSITFIVLVLTLFSDSLFVYTQP